jgi:citrate/tricarballylate utilization protein
VHVRNSRWETPLTPIGLSVLEEGERAMRICNACRYCEGFCAVFPAMERRLTFSEKDLHFLANLCHDCRECFYSCQYAPPHEFALDLPKALAAVRRHTYRKYAWPGVLKTLFQKTGLSVLLGVVAAPVLFLLLVIGFTAPAVVFSEHPPAEGAFYRVVPYAAMTGLFGVLGLGASVALLAGLFKFWGDMGESLGSALSPKALRRAVVESLSLRYLDGGGGGCAYPRDVPSQARRWFHHLTFYGFMLCLAATVTAAAYHHFLGWEAPYPLLSVPVILGTVGGVGLLLGPAGLLWLKRIHQPQPDDRVQAKMDTAFLVLLFQTSLTGFLLLAFRHTVAMGALLAIHLGVVAGLFITLPYGKFVHAIYRFAALARNALEEERAARRQPHP